MNEKGFIVMYLADGVWYLICGTVHKEHYVIPNGILTMELLQKARKYSTFESAKRITTLLWKTNPNAKITETQVNKVSLVLKKMQNNVLGVKFL